MATIFSDPFMEQQFSNLQSKSLPYQVRKPPPDLLLLSVVSSSLSLPFPSVTQLDQFALLENAMNTTAGGSCFDPSSSSSLYYSQAALSGLGGSHGSLQDPVHMRSNMLYSNCSGGLPNIILTGKWDGIFSWSTFLSDELEKAWKGFA